MNREEIVIVEGLDDYPHSLKSNDIDWIVKEAEYYKKHYNLVLKSKLQIEAFKKASLIEVGIRHIQGVHTYDILRNPLYRRWFQYIPI